MSNREADWDGERVMAILLNKILVHWENKDSLKKLEGCCKGASVLSDVMRLSSSSSMTSNFFQSS
jgi:hypothetical protein